jgi:hypothetical protein
MSASIRMFSSLFPMFETRSRFLNFCFDMCPVK